MRAYMTVDMGSSRLGTLELVLYSDTVPRTVNNFAALLQRGEGTGYAGCKFHRIIRGFMAQGGDFTHGDGTGGESIYGPSFDDENFRHTHDMRGILSMANSGPNTNGSQFFITFRPTPYLDGKHVVFGHVDLSKSAAVLDAMEQVATGKDDVPRITIKISECGISDDGQSALPRDNDEEAPAAGEEEPVPQEEQTKEEEHPVQGKNDGVIDDEIDLPDEDEDDGKPKTKSQLLRDRLRKLKMKTNQARQLNRQEVIREGERLGSAEGAAKERKRQAKHDRKLREAEWEARNAKALHTATDAGVDGKFLVEPAVESIKKSTRKAEKAERSRFGVNDYYNPEGQYRNYERNLNSLPSHASVERGSADATSTFDPMMAVSTSGKEDAHGREGARRLSNELKRRIEKKAKNKRNRNEFDATDVSYINQRNKRFNEKISRSYDEHTAEIRQNLERGTAL